MGMHGGDVGRWAPVKRKARLAWSMAFGVAAAALVLVYVTSVRAEAARAQRDALERYGGDLVSVCVATRDIEPGETIDEGNVRVEEWAASLLPDEALTSLEKAHGKTATSRIPKRAPLSSVYFERRDGEIEVPRGKAAVSVACDAERAVGGALERGERVDVYVSKDGVTDRLASAEVLDTSALADGGGDVSWVTLAVNDSSVRELLTATAQGTVSLTVPGARSSEDDGGDR